MDEQQAGASDYIRMPIIPPAVSDARRPPLMYLGVLPTMYGGWLTIAHSAICLAFGHAHDAMARVVAAI
jgi:hypothetical protein